MMMDVGFGEMREGSCEPLTQKLDIVRCGDRIGLIGVIPRNKYELLTMFELIEHTIV
jgi:hypothetical protein